MSVETVARRYASALADVVVRSGETAEVRNELSAWNQMIHDNAQLRDVFASPAIGHSNKEGILEGLLERARPTKTTANFLRVLLRNDRLTDLTAINEKLESVIEERSGAVKGFVTSAHELSEEQRNELRENLAALTGKTVTLEYSIDPELIGGVVTRVGSTVYDGSVRTQLEILKEQLLQK